MEEYVRQQVGLVPRDPPVTAELSPTTAEPIVISPVVTPSADVNVELKMVEQIQVSYKYCNVSYGSKRGLHWRHAASRTW